MNHSDEYLVRFARPEDAAKLPAIERAATEIFPASDLPAQLRSQVYPVEDLERAVGEGRVIVVAARSVDEPVGFALMNQVDGVAHLAEIDVLPSHARQGLGTVLLNAVVDWTRDRGLSAITLTTFRHLPWNAPFYLRRGYRTLAPGELTPGLVELLEEEVAKGLDPMRRVAMRRDLEG